MGRVPKVIEHRVKKNVKPGICRIIENGKGCTRDTHCRGLCPKHHTYFLRWGKMDEFAAAMKFVYVEQASYKINKDAPAGQCRLIENGTICTRHVHGRGLCARHWLTLERHGLHDKFGTTSRKDPRKFRVKKNIKKGICRIIENRDGCTGKAVSRGLCSKHYLRFIRSKQLEQYGTEKPKAKSSPS
ncbi:MAG: hypothetical protein V3V74_07525 [Nitrosomonadaceae bacterium]